MSNDHKTGIPPIDLEHDGVWRFLEECIGDHVPPLLFTGPVGVGKQITAIDFARRLCCDREPACTIDGDYCEACQSVLRLEHPAVQLVYPTPTQGSGEIGGDDESDLARILAAKREDIFSTHEFKKKVSLRIAQSRGIIQRANIKPFGDGYNIFIINDIHEMREAAQNALLKTIEEPPKRCVLILITSNPDVLLYTVRSRCQRVRFGPVKPSVVEKILVESYGKDAKIARKAAELSQGNVPRALKIAEATDDDTKRHDVFEIIDRIQRAPDSWVIKKALSVNKGGNRDTAAHFLHELAVACRDVMTGDDMLFINSDQRSFLAKQVATWDRKRLPAVVDRILDTRDGVVRRNWNIDAALVDLFLDIKHSRC
ncbi:MAG: AAA family ATPase [bacterium]|nr:AAA family ATPase [bacterium]